MTAMFWMLFVAYVVTNILVGLLYRAHQRLARACEDMTDLYDSQGAEFRAAYRDLITQYERLHTKYKELQRDSD